MSIERGVLGPDGYCKTCGTCPGQPPSVGEQKIFYKDLYDNATAKDLMIGLYHAPNTCLPKHRAT